MQDAQKAALNELGYTGSNQDMEKSFLTDTLGKAVPNQQGMFEWLGSLGFTAYALQDRMKAYLNSLGYSGAINEMLKASFVARTFYNALRAIFNKFGSGAHRYTFGPAVPVLGPELVTNGDGSTTAGWTISGGTQASVGGEIQITSTSAAPFATQQTISTTIGKTYQVVGNVRNASGGQAATIDVWNGLTQAAIVTGNSAGITSTGTFVAGGSTADIKLKLAANGVGQVAGFDNISVREILSYTDTYDGFHAGNYQYSTGTTVGVIDSPIGLVLDGAGSVSANLAIDANWSTSANVVRSGNQFTLTSATATLAAQQTIVTANKTYEVTFAIDSISSGSLSITLEGGSATTPTYSAAGTYSARLLATNTGNVFLYLRSTPCTAVVRIIGFKEVTGIHATQATAGNKPVMRRGIVNLLTYSNDLTNVAWLTSAGASKISATTATFTTSVSDTLYRTTIVSANASYTLAVLLSGDAGKQIKIRNEDNGSPWNGSEQTITLSATPTLYAVSYASTLTSMTNMLRSVGQACSVTIGGAALFQGTLTASQIAAYGGIPLTTTVPASSSAGPVFSEYGAALNSKLGLGSVPLQMTDDFCIVTAFKVTESSASWRTMFGERHNTGAARMQFYCMNGAPQLYLRDDASANLTLNSATSVYQSDAIATVWKVGSSVVLRLNGVQKASGTVSLGTATFNSAAVGNLGDQVGATDNFEGRIYDFMPEKGTFSLADIQTMEANAARKAGGRLVGGNFVSNI